MNQQPGPSGIAGVTTRVALRLLKKALPFGLALIAVVVTFNNVIMPRFVHHGKEVQVPDVTGLPVHEAMRLLYTLNLSVRDTVLVSSPKVPAGHVVDQHPRANVWIKPGRGMRLMLSRGLVAKEIPDLRGQTLRSARLALNREGYDQGDVVYMPSSETRRDHVVATDPPAEAVVAPGELVHLLVSSGPRPNQWVMPDLAGEELQLTVDKLKFAGFVPVLADAGSSWLMGALRVRYTFPPPGALVAEGDTIRLYRR